jgi:hypothetical protein
VRVLEGGVLVSGALQLDDGQRQAINVEDDVETTLVLAVDDSDLVDSVIGVRGRVPQVDEADGGGVLRAELVGVGDGADAGDQVVVGEPILG